MHIEEKQLKEFIIDSGLVSRADIELAEKEGLEKGENLGKALVSKGRLSEDDLRRIQAYTLGIPFVDLRGEKLPFEILSLIPEPIARNHNIVAFKKTETALEVAMLNTEDLTAIDFIKKKVGLKILPRLTDGESMKNALLQYQKSLKAEFGDLIAKDIVSLKAVPDDNLDGRANEEEMKKLAEDIPVIRVVDTLIKHAIIQNASDIHIEPEENGLLVRYRIDGILHDAMVLPKNVTVSIVARVKVLANLKLDEKRLPQDGRFKIDSSGEKVSFRVSTLPTYYGEKVVMRLLRENVSGFTLESLGFHGTGLERIHKAVKFTTGMILATGPTGSGKTTTLYTFINTLNESGTKIITIEDPIEYHIPGISQTQVDPKKKYTFANGLRAIVRQDPDIILVGEIRDRETAEIALNAALTGHLVLSTIHTNDAAGIVPRLIDLGVKTQIIAPAINLSIAQRLLRKLCPDCKKPVKVTSEDLAKIKKVLEPIQKIVDFTKLTLSLKLYEAGQCQKCNSSGYLGRTGVFELFKVSKNIERLILTSPSILDIEEAAIKEGMTTMLQDAYLKLLDGITSMEEIEKTL